MSDMLTSHVVVLARTWSSFCSHRQASVWRVAAGKHYETKINRHLQVRHATTIIVHSSYDSMSSDNDIALVKVDTPFQLNTYVSSVCLPTTQPTVGDYCYITGWGYIESKFSLIYYSAIWSLYRHMACSVLVSCKAKGYRN